ncbi:MAG: mechanosensitive ion channel family protein, partial [Bacteroidota bacterium]
AATDAAELVRGIDGVVYVVDGVEANVEVEARVTPAVERVQEYVRKAIAYLPLIGVAVVVFMVFVLLGWWVSRWEAPFRRLGLSTLARNLIRRTLRLIVLLTGLLLVLDILGVTALVGAVLGAAGLLGVAIGFAFQDIVENYLAGVLLSVRQPFALGDAVRIGDEEGKVMRLTARELLLMTYDGNHFRIPNASVFKSTIYNFSRNPLRRFAFEAGIGVEEDLEQVRRLGLDALDAMAGVIEKPAPMMIVKALGDSSVIVTFFGWVDQREADFMKVKSEAIRVVKATLDEAEVLMPEPIYNVRMQSVPPDRNLLAPGKPVKPAAAPSTFVDQRDVAADATIDEQIQADLASENEQNLLQDG